ncbi:RNA polymerase sigma factor RpoE [Balneatrix alpica]|uniref:RNA polymerase sigma factor n=1 Tax=Balneatrix alpica TaxID=75684 RepID=A0ABV5Z9K9_9GAMM|nr:RNA polymerase sigma factor RpoE [Balneatrix alpica]
MDSLDADAALVQRAKQGDTRAYDLLVIKYQHRILALVRRFVGDADALDVAQEAFIKAYRSLANFREDSAFYTWLYRIAVNTAKNYLAARGRRPPSADVDVDDAQHLEVGAPLHDHSTPEQELNKERVQQVIRTTLAQLPEELRVALTLREFDGLSYEDIAQIMDCPVGTVRSRIFRAREAIEKNLAPLL